MRLPQTINEHVANLTALEAFEMLCALGNPGATVFANQCIWDVRELIKDPTISTCKAGDVGPVKFWGGPPGALRYYNGTLLSVVKDRILDSLRTLGSHRTHQIVANPRKGATHTQVEYDGVGST